MGLQGATEQHFRGGQSGGQQPKQGPGTLRQRTTGQVFDRLQQGDKRFLCDLIRGWLRTLRGFLRPTGHGRRQGELLQGEVHGNLQQGGAQGDVHGDGGQGLHFGGGGHGLHGRHGFPQQDDLQHFLHGTERHGIGPQGFLHPFLQHLGLQGDGRHTIILHFGGRQGPGGEHGIGQGELQGGGLEGGGVHSNISSFLASGAPVILRITNSNTPRRGFVTVDTFTGACSSPDEATIHFGP